MFVAKAFLVASLALSASAMITPHHIARRADHHAIAARVAEPEPVVVAPVHVSPRKRAVKRCAAPSSSSLSSSATPTPTPSPSPAPVNNVGQDPPKQPSPPPSPSPAPAKENPPPSKPAPPPTKAPAPTTKAAPPPSPSPNPPSGGGGSGPTYSGDGTFYETGLGACGIVNTDADFIAAIGHAAFDSYPGYNGGNPNNNPICGKKVTAHYQGKSVTVAITDRCGGCDIATSLDFSPAAFDVLADPSVGRIHGVTWQYV